VVSLGAVETDYFVSCCTLVKQEMMLMLLEVAVVGKQEVCCHLRRAALHDAVLVAVAVSLPPSLIDVLAF